MPQPPEIGKHISLISNSNIRYEGQLLSLDPNNNTVSLTNVRIFGTEGRKGGRDEIPPSDELFEYIVFRGSDIKDLTLYEEAAPTDPAIVSSGPAVAGGPAAAGPKSGGANKPPSITQRDLYDHMESNHSAPRRGAFGGNNRRYDDNNRYQRGGYGGSRTHNSTGGATQYRRRQDGHTGQDFRPATGSLKEEFKEDFDFSKCREEFQKKKKDFEKAKEEAKSHGRAYNKSSFFDMVSCDEKRGGFRMDREEMKKADTETFGPDMVGSMRGFRRGRGGRGQFQRY